MVGLRDISPSAGANGVHRIGSRIPTILRYTHNVR